jgi:hypothetical protein
VFLKTLPRPGKNKPDFNGAVIYKFVRSWVMVIFLLFLLKPLNILLKEVITLLFSDILHSVYQLPNFQMKAVSPDNAEISKMSHNYFLHCSAFKIFAPVIY